MKRSSSPGWHTTEMLARLFLSRRLDRFVRVLDQTLGAADCTRHVEASVEIPQIFRGFEGFLERGFR